MTVRGETIREGAAPTCGTCSHAFEYEVLHSNAGHYIGTTCHNPGCEDSGMPNSRARREGARSRELRPMSPVVFPLKGDEDVDDSALEQMRAKGYGVTIYDRYDRAGGLLIYGIPNFKLEKPVL